MKQVGVGTGSYQGLLASLVGARTLLGAPGLTTRNKKQVGVGACKYICAKYGDPSRGNEVNSQEFSAFKEKHLLSHAKL